MPDQTKSYTVSINETKLRIDRDEYRSEVVDGAAEMPDVYRRGSLFQYTVMLKDGRSVPLFVERDSDNERAYTVYVSGKSISLELETPHDLRLKSLSKSTASGRVVSQMVKAPMPGLLKSVIVEQGSQVKKGEPLCILEAMKMENEIKSPGDYIVKRILSEEGAAVERNTPLMELTLE